ncbi:MAG: hypothetical protein HY294_15465 [Candidatus Rokubacteria bacterium]|nr:hypothetical protein [Candidatus Rokubacteria bacterium]
MTYGFRPENWPAFQHELDARDIATADIEKIEIRDVDPAIADVTVTLRSGRVESWRHGRIPS